MTALRTLLALAGRKKPEPLTGIDWDGSNDYVSRSSDLIGNSDGKLVTFSYFFYPIAGENVTIYVASSGSGAIVNVTHTPGSYHQIQVRNSSATTIGRIRLADKVISDNTWNSVIVSLDMAALSKWKVYVNDAAAPFTTPIYTNDTIDFTQPFHYVMATYNAIPVAGRLAHFLMKQEYYDLDTESERRKFVTADLNPVDATSLNPILYCKMADPTRPGLNSGTGGDLTLTGVVAQSGRGANQYNVAMSAFNGTTDYTGRTSALTGATAGKLFTFNGNFRANSFANEAPLFSIGDGTNEYFTVQPLSSGKARVTGRNSAGAVILNYETTNAVLAVNKSHSIQVSGDMADSSTMAIVVDGDDQAVTLTTVTNDNLSFDQPRQTIGNVTKYSAHFDGSLGDIWFNTERVDLAASNPFYRNGKPTALGADGSTPTGNVPLVYCQMYGNDAGTNKGSGGDFTEYGSSPYDGARGTSEFWAGCADFDGVVQHIYNSSALLANSKQLTVAIAFKHATGTLGSSQRLIDGDASTVSRGRLSYSGNNLKFVWNNTSGTTILDLTSNVAVNDTDWHIALISVDLAVPGSASFTVDGNAGFVQTTYTDDTLDLDGRITFAADGVGGNNWPGTLGWVWMASGTYVNFNTEANWLKWMDAFRYPVDLNVNGSGPTGSQPPIYLNRNVHLGQNDGSGSDFTPQNSPTDGGHVKG